MVVERYKTFPPRWSHIRVPMSSRAAARAAVALYAPCTPKGRLGQQLAWTLVSTLGPRALPGAAAPWQPPMSASIWEQLLEGWSEILGDHDALAVYERPQEDRPGLSILTLRRGHPTGFVRVRRAAGEVFDAELRVLRHLESVGVSLFWHPRALGTVGVAGWQSLVTTTMPPALHRPAFDVDIDRISHTISTALRSGPPRPEDAPAHWEPMHGDLTPWNLRRVRGNLALFDWEDAGWGPPEADITLFKAAVVALRGGPPVAAPSEAASFWLQRLDRKGSGAIDETLSSRLRAALAASPTRS